MKIHQHRELIDRYILVVSMTPAEAQQISNSPVNIGGRMYTDPDESPFDHAVKKGEPTKAFLAFEFSLSPEVETLADEDVNVPKQTAYEEQQVAQVRGLIKAAMSAAPTDEAVQGPETPLPSEGKKL